MSADLEKVAADLFESGRFLDASGKFDAAAQAAKDSSEPVERVRRLRGWARLSFGRYVTSQPDIAANPDKLTQAAQAFSEAKELLDNELAKQTAYGFMSWMLGHRALLTGSFIEGTSHCWDAKQALSQVLDTPGLPDGFRSSIGDSIRRINWDLLDGEIMRSSVQPDAIGEAKALLEAVKPDMPEDRARVYEFQIAVIAPVLAGYEGGLTLAERWDPNAKKYFEDMSQPLKSWREKDDVLGDRWRPSLAHMARGWQLVSQGEIHHANALRDYSNGAHRWRRRTKLGWQPMHTGKQKENSAKRECPEA